VVVNRGRLQHHDAHRSVSKYLVSDGTNIFCGIFPKIMIPLIVLSF
jgi:hypothetical protein